jgi:hypothetical protein
MMADAAQDFLDSGGDTSVHPLAPAPAANDATVSADPAQAFLETGGGSSHPVKEKPKEAAKLPWWAATGDTEGDVARGLAAGTEGALSTASGGVGALGGGLTYLGTLAATKGDTKAAKAVQEATQTRLTIPTFTGEGGAVADVLGQGAAYTGQREGEAAGDWVLDKTGSPVLASAANTLANVPQFLAGGELARRGAPRLTETGAPAAEPKPAAPAEAAPDLGIKTEREEAGGNTGELTPEQQQARIALAKRVGLTEVRKSAIEGDAQAAADDYDASKYTGEPVGEQMRATIAAERKGMIKHAEGIVEDAGGEPGRDQTSDIQTGRTIAQPFDDLQAHIEAQKNAMYAAGKARLGDTGVETPELEAALNDRTLKNSLMAQGKTGFLDSVKDQLEAFKENNGGKLNVGTAEQFRQFVNTLWSTDKNAVGKIKAALDNDVGRAAGEDVFAPARAMHGLGKDLLENPDGVRQLFDRDPKTPINRTTAYEDIPDKLSNMDSAQFNNVMDTLDKMPPELSQQAQAAKDAIRAHFANRLLETGSKTETQWNKNGVNKELKANAANYERAFKDRPDLAAKIQDMKDAGEMLRFNSSYRGAHAQASNMVRKGLGAGAQAAGASIGGTVGGIVAGVPGAGYGAIAGRAAVAKGMSALDKSAAKRAAAARVISLKD